MAKTVATTATTMNAQANDFSEVGGRTLEIFSGTPRINEWMYSRFAPFVRGDVLEVGSGIGNLSKLLIRAARTVVLTDTEAAYLSQLKRELESDHVEVHRFDLSEPLPHVLADRQFDAILAVNVLEHIEDDHRAVQMLGDRLKPGGHLLAYVPACPFAYGTLDKALGHYRRYTPHTFAALMRSAGLDPGQVRYMNVLGLLGWFLSGRILKRRELEQGMVGLFESLVPLIRLEDRVPLPIGLGVFACARKIS